MREKKKLLAVLCIAFVCLTGVWALLLATEKKGNGGREQTGENSAQTAENNVNNDSDADVQDSPEDTVYVLSDITAQEVERVEIQNPEAEYVIVPAAVPESPFDGETTSQQAFVLEGYETYGQNREALYETVRLLSSVSAVRIGEGDFEKEKFGLQNPCAAVKISGREESVTFYLGSYNESASVWYAAKEGEEGLYCLSKGVGDRMMASPYDLLDMTLIDAMDSETEDMTKRLTKIVVERPDLEEPLIIAATAEPTDAYTSAYELTSPVCVKTSLKTVREQIASLFGLSAKKAVGVYDETRAADYGLDAPSMVMTVIHDGEELKLTVGGFVSQGEDKDRYLICSDSDLLYIIEEDNLPFFDETADDLFFKIALLPKIDEVGAVYLDLRGEEYLFSLTFEETENDKDADGVKEDTLKVSLDGGDLDAGLFRTFYSFLVEVDIENINRDSYEGEPEMVLEYRYRDGRIDRLEAYRLADARRMGIALNGEASFEGRIAYLDKLQTELFHLLAGEKIDTDW